METIKELVTSALNLQQTQSRQWPHLQKRADNLLTCHSNFNAFCVTFNPSLQKDVANNADRAVLGTAPMLCTIDAAYGEGSAAQWLIPQLYDLCAAVGVKTKLDDNQLKQLAMQIRTEFGYLKATEVMLFLWRLKGGHYGEFYGAVDGQRIMRALRGKFSEERANCIARHESEEREREREQWAKDAASPEEVRRIIEKFQTNN